MIIVVASDSQGSRAELTPVVLTQVRERQAGVLLHKAPQFLDRMVLHNHYRS
jgi:hypothetical protein